MNRPIESDYTSQVAYTRALEAYCDGLPQLAQQEPVLQEIEQYRLQMAGICTAAIGYWKEGDGIHPDYDTVALRDVAKLYAKYDELYRAQSAQRTLVGLTDEQWQEIAAITGCLRIEKRGRDAILRVFEEAAHGIKENT